MPKAELDTLSYWESSSSISRYPKLDRDLTVDVAVIGGGITGFTAAYLLKRSGRTVAVIDRRRSGGVDSSLTTAHVTCVTDEDLGTLVKHFGRDHAWAAWDAGLAAIEQIDRIVTEEESPASGRGSTATNTPFPAGRATSATPCGRKRRRPPSLVSRRGISTACRTSRCRRGVRRPGEVPSAEIPGRLAKAIDGDGSYVFEQTESSGITDEPLAVCANGRPSRAATS
jgi:glycine/D-amino acid oxidase-like deaminating enzyme